MTTQVSFLIVDDERAVRQLLIDGLQQKNYSISEAANGRDALRKLKESTFDFVISDISMKKMDGIKLLDEIKSTHPDTCVVMISGYPDEYKRQEILSAGADCYITKPFSTTEIFDTIETLVERKRKAQNAG